MNRRAFLAAAAFFASAPVNARIHPQYKLIAHRGGIVDAQYPENSPGSLQAAIDRGYWMIEVDVRCTKDGEPVLQHDANFRRFYGNPGTVASMTWAEIQRLRATPGNYAPIHFAEVCRLCEGKTRLMLDIKSADYPESFYRSIKQSMEKHGLLANAYALSGGGPRGEALLTRHCSRSANRTSLKQAIARGEDVARTRFLFELASILDRETVDAARQAHVTVVAAINTFRYTMARRDEEIGPQEDFARVSQLGVTHYQIDSRYEGLFAS